ncbi:hypothetical protein [Bacillus thuringiensis]|nr:hypothetical protein [Bacillus thuringiensis]
MSYGYNCDCDKCKGNCKQSMVNRLEDIQVLIQEQLQLQAQL